MFITYYIMGGPNIYYYDIMGARLNMNSYPIASPTTDATK